MQKSTQNTSPKKFYWAVYDGKTVVYEGSFTQCWEYFTDTFANSTLKQLAADKIRVARKV